MTDAVERHGFGSVERHANGVVTVTLDRPPVNAQRFGDLAALDELMGALATDEDVRCVVLGAAGERAWMPGTDTSELQALTAESAERNTDMVQRLLDRMYELPVPIVAAINGAVLGLGMALASACDIRIASENASFGLPEIDLAVMGGSKHTARLLPQGQVRLMMYTGWRIDAAEAHRLGMLQSVVPLGGLAGEARRVADAIAEKYPPAIRLAKVGLNRTEFVPLKEGYAFECTLTTKLREDPQAAEVARAFLERRTRR